MGKTLVIGLDGVSWDLLQPWLDGGELPFLKKLVAGGAHGKMMGTIPCMTSPAVPSLFTGANPAELGLFSFYKPDGSVVSYSDIKHKAFWDVLGENGLSCCVVGVPLTYPPRIVKGVMISGGAYPTKAYAEGFDLKGIARELRDIREANTRLFDEVLPLVQADAEKSHELLFEVTKKEFDAFASIATKNDFDLSFYWLYNTDILQHNAWHEPETLLAFFRKVDEMLSQLADALPGHNIILVSDHGFHKSPTRAFYVNEWLMRNRHLRLAGNPLKRLFVRLFHLLGTGIYYRMVGLYHTLHTKYPRLGFIQQLMTLARGLASGADTGSAIPSPKLSGFDMEKTKAYMQVTWGIRVVEENVDSDIDGFIDALVSQLKEVRDGGDVVFQDVLRREEIFRGDFLQEVPHIILIPAEDYQPRLGFSGIQAGRLPKPKNTGSHLSAREALFIACGPDYIKGCEVRLCVEDLAPTILKQMGVRPPKGLGGSVVVEALRIKDSQVAKRP